ncbi:hypothetical protein OROMI_006164 [Orobanche minor]
MAIHLLCFLSFLIRFHVPHSKFTFSFLTEFYHRKLSRDVALVVISFAHFRYFVISDEGCLLSSRGCLLLSFLCGPMTSSRRLLFDSPSLSTTTATTVVLLQLLYLFFSGLSLNVHLLVFFHLLYLRFIDELKNLKLDTGVMILQELPSLSLLDGLKIVGQQFHAIEYGTWVMMNRVTRRLGKIPDEVKKEVQPFYLNRAAISTEDTDIDKIEKLTDDTAEIIRTGLVPRWSDMDSNQHVNNVKYIGWLLEPRWSDMYANQHLNNVKYIGWLLESVPKNVLEDYNMKRMTLEYRRECRQSNLLESLTSMQAEKAEAEDEEDRIFSSKEDLECRHLLRMEADQVEIVRARSVWRIKQHDHIII